MSGARTASFPRILSKSKFSPFVAFEEKKKVIMLEHCKGKRIYVLAADGTLTGCRRTEKKKKN